MEDPSGQVNDVGSDTGQPRVSLDVGIDGADATGVSRDGDRLEPSETFQTLANEVRVTTLVELLAAERDGENPLSFSQLQEAAGSDSSAGFAYHLRQLSGYFVRQTESGYVLTPAGRRTAEAVVSGTFTVGSDTGRAS